MTTTVLAIILLIVLILLLIAVKTIINLMWQVRGLNQDVKSYRDLLDSQDKFLDRINIILDKILTVTERHDQTIEEELKWIKNRMENKENE